MRALAGILLLATVAACAPAPPEAPGGAPPLGKADGVAEESCRALLADRGRDCCDSSDPFGASPICYDDPTALGSWHRIICRLVNEHVGTGSFERAWGDFLTSLVDQPFAAQLRELDDFVNGFDYRADPAPAGGVDTSWGTGAEALLQDGGDCEDFALVKYLALRELGVPACRLRIAQGYSADYRENHAVLVVMDAEGDPWVLDNARAAVEAVGDYVEGFTVAASVNEANGWLYMP